MRLFSLSIYVWDRLVVYPFIYDEVYSRITITTPNLFAAHNKVKPTLQEVVTFTLFLRLLTDEPTQEKCSANNARVTDFRSCVCVSGVFCHCRRIE